MKKLMKTCSRCGKLHPLGYKCYANSKNYYKESNPEIRKFRSSSLWTNKADEIKDRDHYLCQVCLSKNILNYDDLSVHHILPLREDFSKRLDNNNLITLCEKHHRMCEEGKISRADQLQLIKQHEQD